MRNVATVVLLVAGTEEDRAEAISTTVQVKEDTRMVSILV